MALTFWIPECKDLRSAVTLSALGPHVVIFFLAASRSPSHTQFEEVKSGIPATLQYLVACQDFAYSALLSWSKFGTNPENSFQFSFPTWHSCHSACPPIRRGASRTHALQAVLKVTQELRRIP